MAQPTNSADISNSVADAIAPRFHNLRVSRLIPEAAGSVAVALHVPDELRERFEFTPGQFVTLRASIDGADVRRSYSICSTRKHLAAHQEIVVGIRPMEGGVFSNWAAHQLQAGQSLAVMPPDGRFVSRRPRALHRVGFAAGSGITPILSIMTSALEEQPQSKFTLVYGNRSTGSAMFNEALQDLKDRYPQRLTLIYILSRQAQEVDLLQGRIDAGKVRSLMTTLLPAASMDEVFVCGPEAMIEATVQALRDGGVPATQIHSERFSSPVLDALPADARQAELDRPRAQSTGTVALTVVLDGKSHVLRMRPDQHVLDVALAQGLDLPYSCKGGVCCTCRAKVLDGSVQMDKNFTLEPWETQQGFVLSCQARPTSDSLTVSYDER